MRIDLPPHLAALNPHLVAGKGKAQKVKVGDGYRSTLERRAVNEWLPTQTYDVWLYEPLTFRLKGGRYTPDLMLLYGNAAPRIYEIKGWTQSLRADRRAYLEAARTHTWARFCWLTWDKEFGWREDWGG